MHSYGKPYDQSHLCSIQNDAIVDEADVPSRVLSGGAHPSEQIQHTDGQRRMVAVFDKLAQM